MIKRRGFMKGVVGLGCAAVGVKAVAEVKPQVAAGSRYWPFEKRTKAEFESMYPRINDSNLSEETIKIEFIGPYYTVD